MLWLCVRTCGCLRCNASWDMLSCAGEESDASPLISTTRVCIRFLMLSHSKSISYYIRIAIKFTKTKVKVKVPITTTFIRKGKKKMLKPPGPKCSCNYTHPCFSAPMCESIIYCTRDISLCKLV